MRGKPMSYPFDTILDVAKVREVAAVFRTPRSSRRGHRQFAAGGLRPGRHRSRRRPRSRLPAARDPGGARGRSGRRAGYAATPQLSRAATSRIHYPTAGSYEALDASSLRPSERARFHAGRPSPACPRGGRRKPCDARDRRPSRQIGDLRDKLRLDPVDAGKRTSGDSKRVLRGGGTSEATSYGPMGPAAP
jgi:hypothetical protein